MGVPSGFAFHARDRDGSHRDADHRKAQALQQRRRQRRAVAGLILSLWASLAQAEPLRIATYHTELSRDGPGLLLRDILKGDDQVQAVAQVVQAVNPDVLVVADVDFDLHGHTLNALADRLGGYPHRFALRPNRGIASGRDLNGDGRIGGPEDAEGYATFAGQGGLAIVSKHPILREDVRDFSTFAWADLPGNLAPTDGRNPTRLSTTAHWDVPVHLADGRVLHLLVWHATAPVFDGREDRNGRRNHDEAAFWLAYLAGDLAQTPPRDYVLAGVANADPHDGDSRPEALLQLLNLTQDTRPASAGAERLADTSHTGPAALDTVDWEEGPNRPGNLRVDYVLPSTSLHVHNSGVFWPAPADPLVETVKAASRHRLVWVDVELPVRD